MAAIKLELDRKKWPREVLNHFLMRAKDRTFLPPMVTELAEWFGTKPEVPDLEEAPDGWFLKFSSFTICGEGPFVKTLYTIYSPGTPRCGSVDLANWGKIQKLSSMLEEWLYRPYVRFAYPTPSSRPVYLLSY